VAENRPTSAPVDSEVVHVTVSHRAHPHVGGKMLYARPAIMEQSPVVPATGSAATPQDRLRRQSGSIFQ